MRRFTNCILALATAGALATTTMAGDTGSNAGGTAEPDSASEAIRTLDVAADLAAWGRQAGNPIALALAGAMMGSVGASEMENPPAQMTEVDAPTSAPPKEPGDGLGDGADLIAEARDMAAGNRQVLSAIDRAVDSVPVARGRVGGPVCHDDVVNARATDRYTISFRGGEYASIWVSGDGDTDLDCWVYDQNGNLIESDLRYTDECRLEWVPRWTGPFTLRIQNLGGVWNAYTVCTN